MWSNVRATWTERRLLRQLGKDLAALDGFDPQPARPPRHRGKDFLGAVVTLAIIGAILLELTNGLASECGTKPTPGAADARTCSGLAAFAHQARGAVDMTVAACAALAVIAFVWYMARGYKTNGHARGNKETPSP
jgi:hypothetical protein